MPPPSWKCPIWTSLLHRKSRRVSTTRFPNMGPGQCWIIRTIKDRIWRVMVHLTLLSITGRCLRDYLWGARTWGSLQDRTNLRLGNVITFLSRMSFASASRSPPLRQDLQWYVHCIFNSQDVSWPWFEVEAFFHGIIILQVTECLN